MHGERKKGQREGSQKQVKKGWSRNSLINNNVHLHYVHVHTRVPNSSTPSDALTDVHVSISLCVKRQSLIFFFLTEEDLEQKTLDFTIYNFLDT